MDTPREIETQRKFHVPQTQSSASSSRSRKRLNPEGRVPERVERISQGRVSTPRAVAEEDLVLDFRAREQRA